MLNTCLPVRHGILNSHADKGWEKIHRLCYPNGFGQGVVFLAWGASCQEGCQVRDFFLPSSFLFRLPNQNNFLCILSRTNTWSSRAQWVNISTLRLPSLMKVFVAPVTVSAKFKQRVFFWKWSFQISKQMARTEVWHRWLCRLVWPCADSKGLVHATQRRQSDGPHLQVDRRRPAT